MVQFFRIPGYFAIRLLRQVCYAMNMITFTCVLLHKL